MGMLRVSVRALAGTLVLLLPAFFLVLRSTGCNRGWRCRSGMHLRGCHLALKGRLPLRFLSHEAAILTQPHASPPLRRYHFPPPQSKLNSPLPFTDYHRFSPTWASLWFDCVRGICALPRRRGRSRVTRRLGPVCSSRVWGNGCV